MKQIYDIVSNFNTLKEYAEFMETLVEKKADGNEISRGMNKHDKSKTFKSKEVKKNANGSSTETHYSQTDASLEQVPEPAAPPPQPIPPGQQTKIGNKMVDQQQTGPKTRAIELSGKKQKLNMKPMMKKNPKLQTP